MKSSIPMSFGEKTESDFSFSIQKGKGSFLCPLHWHDCFELFYVCGGRFGVQLRDERLILECGDVAVLPPRTLHGTHSLGVPYENHVFGYVNHLIYTPDLSYRNLKYLSPFLRTFPAEEHVIRADHPLADALHQHLDAAMRAADEASFDRELRVRAEILGIHAVLCRRYVEEQKGGERANGYLSAAARYIEAHIAEPITPTALAEELHVSYSHLASLFHHHLGYSAGELITRMKMSEAERLMLSHREMGITELAAAVGYDNVSYFIRCFRRIRGCSPGTFRKQYAL